MPRYEKNVEILAQALIAYSGFTDPTGPLFKAMNPGGIRATSMKHPRNENGQRVFNSFIDGIQALFFDLETKLSGDSWAGLTGESTLEDLALSYSRQATEADAWARFLRKALADSGISKRTPLSYFKGNQ